MANGETLAQKLVLSNNRPQPYWRLPSCHGGVTGGDSKVFLGPQGPWAGPFIFVWTGCGASTSLPLPKAPEVFGALWSRTHLRKGCMGTRWDSSTHRRRQARFQEDGGWGPPSQIPCPYRREEEPMLEHISVPTHIPAGTEESSFNPNLRFSDILERVIPTFHWVLRNVYMKCKVLTTWKFSSIANQWRKDWCWTNRAGKRYQFGESFTTLLRMPPMFHMD